MLELTLRLIFSLAAVLGLLALLVRVGGRKFKGGRDAMIRVVHRQAISRGTSVSVVTVGSRVLVLGTTEHQVRVLAELDPEELGDADVLSLVQTDEESSELASVAPITAPAAPAATRGSHRADTRAVTSPASGALAGSVLSVGTWRQALAAATRRAS